MKFNTAVAMALGVQGVFGSMLLKNEKYAEWEKYAKKGLFNRRQLSSIRNQPAQCNDATNTVEIGGESFPCSNVDFLSFVSLNEIEITSRPHQSTGMASADVWGWVSPTGKEITLHCMDNGMAVIDTTKPEDPCVIGLLPSVRRADPWCDIKVFENTAYIVKDSRGGDYANDTDIGGQVLDLLPLDDVVCNDLSAPLTLEANHVWNFHGSTHNIHANPATKRLFSVGSDYCAGGIIVMDLAEDRLKPGYVGCIDGDGYTHDIQCVIYDGPDKRFEGHEICFAFNEDTLTIWDLTKWNIAANAQPRMLARLEYPSQAYCHQGSLNADMTLLLMDDELNERCSSIPVDDRTGSCVKHPLGPLNGITKTSTIVVDIGKFGSLTNPIFTGTFLHKDDSIDHNLYVWNVWAKQEAGWENKELPSPKFAYLSNYVAGLRILDISSNKVERFREVGYFDVAPDVSELTYLGTWSNYLFPSGNMAVSSIERGLFMLKPRMVFDRTGLEEEEPSNDGDNGSGSSASETAIFTFLGLAVIAVLVIITGLAAVRANKREAEKAAQVANV